MIYSKAGLSVVKVASGEPFDRALNGVRFEPDGSTAAGNGKVFMCVSPIEYAEKLKEKFALAGLMSPGDRGLVMSVEAIEKALRYMSRGGNFWLDHAAMTRVTDPARVGFTSIDANGDPSTNASLPKNEVYPDWKSMAAKMFGSGGGVGLQVVINRKDLINLLQGLESACPDKGGLNPVFVQATPEGLVLRCLNHETNQRAIGFIGVYKTHGQWLPLSAWERVLFKVKALVKKVVAG